MSEVCERGGNVNAGASFDLEVPDAERLGAFNVSLLREELLLVLLLDARSGCLLLGKAALALVLLVVAVGLMAGCPLALEVRLRGCDCCDDVLRLVGLSGRVVRLVGPMMMMIIADD